MRRNNKPLSMKSAAIRKRNSRANQTPEEKAVENEKGKLHKRTRRAGNQLIF